MSQKYEKCTEHVIIIPHHHHSQKVHTKSLIIINPAAYHASAPRAPGNLIRKGRTTSTSYPHHFLDNLLFSHLAAPGHNIVIWAQIREVKVWRNLEVVFVVFMFLENGKVMLLHLLKHRIQRQLTTAKFQRQLTAGGLQNGS